MRFNFLGVIAVLFVMFTTAMTASAADKIRMQLDLRKSPVAKIAIAKSTDVAGENTRDGTIDIIGSPEYLELLKSQGYAVTQIEAQPKRLDERYLRSDEIRVIANELAFRYPELVHVEEIGRTLRGKPILAVRVTSPKNLQFKPSILFNGMHHAREIMTTEVTVDILMYLAMNYDNSEKPWVAQWLDTTQVWVVPQVNPDGSDIVWSSDTWWRKNARGDQDGEAYGVDINRNYPYAWNSCGGSSGSRGAQDFHGDSAGSEPETQAMTKFILEHNFAISVSYHSYSELVLSPYGCTNQITPEDFIVQHIGMEFARQLKTDAAIAAHGLKAATQTYQYGTPWQILYPVDGDDVSFLYHETNTMAYVVEMNSSREGFQPDYDKWRNLTISNQRNGWGFLLTRLAAGPQVRGRMIDAQTGAPVNGSISIATVNYKTEKPRRAKDGVYTKLMAPGSYELIYSAPGYQTQTLALSIDQGVVVQDVAMEKAFLE